MVGIQVRKLTRCIFVKVNNVILLGRKNDIEESVMTDKWLGPC